MTPKDRIDHRPLPATALRQVCDSLALSFETTAELEPIDELIGQRRALSAIDFGTQIEHDGYHIFALGPTRSGRHGAIRKLLERKAASEPVPDDWVYVNNFAAPDRPKAIRLPSGVGLKLKSSMPELIDDDFEAAQEKAFDRLEQKAQAENIGIIQTPMGFALAPMS